MSVDHYLLRGERGLSADAIAYHLGRADIERSDHHPHDLDDVRRCRLVLSTLPHVNIFGMGHVSRQWFELSKHWHTICSLINSGRTLTATRLLRALLDVAEIVEEESKP